METLRIPMEKIETLKYENNYLVLSYEKNEITTEEKKDVIIKMNNGKLFNDYSKQNYISFMKELCNFVGADNVNRNFESYIRLEEVKGRTVPLNEEKTYHINCSYSNDTMMRNLGRIYKVYPYFEYELK